ncbi:MAG: hypothetical protein D3906_02980, partial [Candidatus Electrothrix sp. AUS1_2]|nr:hypothetical protein [Candidatus Electrothrix sp. AUS1_2]
MNEFERQISKAYFNNESIRLTRINGGHTNLNFLVTHNRDDFFLKLYRYQTANLVTLEIETICQLVEEGFRTPSIISSTSGDSCIETSEGLVVISEFIDGSHPVPINNDVYNIGSLMAHLHLITPYH